MLPSPLKLLDATPTLFPGYPFATLFASPEPWSSPPESLSPSRKASPGRLGTLIRFTEPKVTFAIVTVGSSVIVVWRGLRVDAGGGESEMLRGMVRCVEGVPGERGSREEDMDCSLGMSMAEVPSVREGSRIGSLGAKDCGWYLSMVVESWGKGGIGEVLARREIARVREMDRYMIDQIGGS